MTYTEDNLTEQPAIKLFESLGWQTANCYSESFGKKSSGSGALPSIGQN